MSEDDRPRGGRDGERPEPSSDPAEAPIDRVPIGAGGEHPNADGPDRNEAGDDEGTVVGPEPRSTPVEAGSPSLENALFVLLGALATVFVFVQVTRAFLVG